MLEVPNHTQIPNVIIDQLMSELSHAQFKVLIAICRKTIGWQKQTDSISISQLTELTGVTKKTVIESLKALEKLRLITTKKEYRKTTDITINYQVSSVISTPPQEQSGVISTPPAGVIVTHTKEIVKENIYSKFVELWNTIYGTNLRITDAKRKQIKARLKTFSEDEIIQSISNRSKDNWINGEGRKFRSNWDSFWRNDEKIERYLNSNEGSVSLDGWQEAVL